MNGVSPDAGFAALMGAVTCILAGAVFALAGYGVVQCAAAFVDMFLN
mgnify:CR=1 FL=1